MTMNMPKKRNKLPVYSCVLMTVKCNQDEMNKLLYIKRVWQCTSRYVIAILSFSALLVTLLLFFDINFSTLCNWVRWRTPVEEVPENELTILISQFRFDTDGRYTSEIKVELQNEGWESIRFRPTLTADELIESSRARDVSELEAVAELFERHGGDVLITGELAAEDGVLRVRIFDKAGNDPIKIKLDVREEWIEALSLHVEKIVLNSLVHAGTLRYGDSSDEFLQRVQPIESKILQLVEMTPASPLHEDVKDGHRHLSIKIGEILGDISRLTSARQELESKLSNRGSFQTVQERITAMGDVVDLLRVEALVLGDARLLNKSFGLSKEIRILLGVNPDDDLVYEDGLRDNPIYRTTLELDSVAALACRDKRRIDELLKIYEQGRCLSYGYNGY